MYYETLKYGVLEVQQNSLQHRPAQFSVTKDDAFSSSFLALSIVSFIFKVAAN